MTVEDPGKSLNVRPVRGEDFAQWRVLYRGYADFYKAKQSDEMAAQVWSWLQDPEHVVQGLVVEEGRRRGISTPANETLVEVTRRIYLGELKPDPANLAIALELLNAKMRSAAR